jgi:hypothetical protein
MVCGIPPWTSCWKKTLKWRRKDRLYRCLDRCWSIKQELFVYLKQKWADLFGADFEVLLYDLTSTYFEGEMDRTRKPSAATAGIGGRIACNW